MELSGRPLSGSRTDRELFVDRAPELAAVIRSVRSRTNVLVLGERGVGKTSFLHEAEARLADEGIVATFLEGGVAGDAVEFLRLLVYRLAPRRAPDVDWRLGGLPASALLLEYVRELHTVLEGETAPRVVLVDELLRPDTAHVLFGRLRDEIWRLPLTWVVAASTYDRVTYLRPPADAFFGTIVVLEAWSEPDLQLLLAKRLDDELISPASVDELVAAAEGNPRRAIRLAAEAMADGGRVTRLAAREKRRDEALAGLSEVERRVVADIDASGPASASDAAFLARVGVGRSRAAQLLAGLERKGVLRGQLERPVGRRPRKLYELA